MFHSLVVFLSVELLLGESSSSFPSNFWEVDKAKGEDNGGEFLQSFDYLRSGRDKNVIGATENGSTGIEKMEWTKGAGGAVGANILQDNEPNRDTNVMIPTLDDETRSNQFPCPSEELITPCVCQLDQQMELVMDCSNVTSSEELAKAFQSEFPVLEFSYFIMSHNPNVTYLDDLFNGVSFQHIFITDVVNLEVITDYGFMDSSETLASLIIDTSKLHRYTFPFITIGEYRQLKDLQLSFAQQLTSIPEIITDYLTRISFDSSGIASIENNTFSRAPMLEEINLNFNKIASLPSGSFLLRAALTNIGLQHNTMTTMEPGAFVADPEGSSDQTLTIQLSSNDLTLLEANTFTLTDRPTTIELNNNSINRVEAGAFVMPPTAEASSLHIDLRNNMMTALEQEVWEEMFPSIVTLRVEGNPLSCGCSLAWLVLDEVLLSKLDEGATCEDGTLLTSLWEGDFATCYLTDVEK